jgi:hypothetical protein
MSDANKEQRMSFVFIDANQRGFKVARLETDESQRGTQAQLSMKTERTRYR